MCAFNRLRRGVYVFSFLNCLQNMFLRILCRKFDDVRCLPDEGRCKELLRNCRFEAFTMVDGCHTLGLLPINRYIIHMRYIY